MNAQPQTLGTIEWRIVQKIRAVTGTVEFAGTVDETDREDLSHIIRTGITDASLEQIRRWTAESIGFYDDQASSYELGDEEYLYYLQVKQEGKFRNVKSLKPAMLPDQDDGYDDEGDDYVSTDTVYARAYDHFGNSEMAREAASMYPGDFI